jgi:hypothetical protein
MRTPNNRWPLVLTVLAWIAFVMPVLAIHRTLTANDGRTLHARLVSKTDETVGIIRTSDSQWFELAIKDLSEADREFIRNWTPKSKQVWNQDVFKREMVQPVEGFETFQVQRARRQPRCFYHTSPGFVHFGGHWPTYQIPN